MKKISVYKLSLIFLLFNLVFTPGILSGEELLVFAAIGGRQPLTEIAEQFESETGIHIIYDFGGTGRLANKVFVGQSPDVFIAGSEKWAGILVERNFCEKFHPIVWHTPVIIANVKSGMDSLSQLADKNFRIALGDPDACAIGATTLKIFDNLQLTTDDVNLSALGITVKQLVFWVETGAADCSIVWYADAVQSGKVKIIEIPQDKNAPSYIPIGLMQSSEHKAAAEKFVSFVLTTGKKIFVKHGFKEWDGTL